MSNLVKIILFVAFAIFAVGFIWAIVVAVKKPKETAKTTDKPATEQQVAAPTPAPANPAPVVAPQPTVAPAPNRSKTTTTRRNQTRWYVTYESDNSAVATSGNAWANAGIDANGNAYAEAHAN
jgi:hypothetical protein